MELSLHSKIKGHGEPIILLHGLFGASDNLGRLSTSLCDQYQVHSLDLRNHGRSPHSDQMNYQLMANDVHAYLIKQNIDRVRILGHSMGGKVAMKFALEFPERVNKLIVVDIAPVAYPAHHEQVFKGLLSVNLQEIKSRAEADKALSEYILEQSVRQLLLKSLTRDTEGNFAWKINVHAIYQNYPNILSGLSADKPYRSDVLFVAGGLSDYLKASDKNEILKLFPKATIRVIPKAGHWLHVEKPELFLGICERFLKEV